MNSCKLIVGFAPMLTLTSTAIAATTAQPNIILMVSDDHGKDALGCYGNDIIKTPALDKLASEGVRFTNAFCTSASSAASRSVLLSGQFGHATGAYGHTHDYHHFSTYDNVKSLPVLLAESGYTTARIGKYHVAPESVYHFDEVIEADPRNTVEMAENSKHVFDSDAPFFLYFCTDDPHRSDFTTSTRDWREPNPFGNKSEGYDGVKTIVYDPQDVVVPPFLPDNQETRREIAEYYQSISRIDQGVERLMNYLKESGKEDNTIVIYISDNGMAFPAAKTTLYDAGIELPCIIKDPQSNDKGKVNSSMISWVDMTPTILEMARVKYDKKAFHGRSFRDIIGESDSKDRDKIYASHTFHEITMYYPMRVVREREYKLIWNAAWRLEYPFASDLWVSSTWQSVYRNHEKMFGGRKTKDYLFRPEYELYNIKDDPNETTNLAGKKGCQEILERMKSDLKSWQLKTKDPWYILYDNDPTMQGSGETL